MSNQIIKSQLPIERREIMKKCLLVLSTILIFASAPTVNAQSTDIEQLQQEAKEKMADLT